MSLTSFFQTLFAALSSQVGAGLIGCILLIGFLRMAAEHRAHYVVWAGLGGAGVFSVSWIMSSMMGLPAP